MLLERTEELRECLALENVDELVHGPARRRGAERLVGQQGQGRLVLGMLQHAVQFGLLPPLGRRLQLGRSRLQPCGDKEGLLHQEVERAGRVRLKTSKQRLRSVRWS